MIINTLPLNILGNIFEPKPPKSIIDSIKDIKFRNVKLCVLYLDKPKFRDILIYDLMHLRFCIHYDTDSLTYDALSCYLDSLEELIVDCINKSNNTLPGIGT